MRRPLLTALVVLVAISAALLIGRAQSASANASVIPTNVALGDQARDAARASLLALSVKTHADDSQWYSKGVWHYKGAPCWFCATGPGTLAATLWRVDGRHETRLLQQARATFDRAIADHTNADGSFGNPQTPDTQFFGVELGTTYLLLGDHLGNERRTAWKAAIAGGASYLITSKNLTWETNGNINLGQAEFEWLAWAITGKQRFHDAYELALKYTVDPPQSRWRGYGMRLTRPASALLPGGAGYLAENGGSGPGFDPEYSMLQLSVASRAFLLSNDPRFGRIANLIWNQLSPLISRKSWLLDATNGTRRSHTDPVTTPGVVVLAKAGSRPDLARLVSAQTTSGMYGPYVSNARDNIGNAGYFRGYGNELGVALLALAAPPAEDGRLSLNSLSGSQGGAHGHRVRSVHASVRRTGVMTKWKVGGYPVEGTGVFDLSIDGHPSKRVRGTTALLHLSAGLHQISVSVTGVPWTAASAVVTVPKSDGST